MPQLSTRAVLLAALVPVLAACGDREPSPTLADRAAALSAGMNVDTLLVGGVPTPVTFNEASGSSFPIPFDVRIPNPMRIGREATDAGDVVSFKLNAPPEDGVATVVALDSTLDEAGARTAARALAEAQGTAADADPAAPAWAVTSFATEADGRSGAVWLGQHGGRYFAATSDAAAAGAEAFTARRDYLFQHWTWTDDGSSLLSR